MKENKRVLMLGHLAYIIMQFNIPNIKLLIDMGYEVDVACNFELKYNTVLIEDKIENFKKQLNTMGCNYYQIDFHRSPLHIGMNIRAYKQVTKLLQDNNYKFVHCHSPIGGFVGRLACKTNNTKSIYTAHGFHFFKGAPLFNWLFYYPVEWLCSWCTEVQVTITKEDFELAKRRFHAKKVEYVPGVGIDFKKFSEQRDREVKKIRDELGVLENDVLLLSVGELNKNKNHEAVIRAIKELSNERVHYCIAGTGELREYLQKLIIELKVEKQIHLLGFRKDVPALLQAIDIYIHPSFREGLSVAIMEAMASGRPIICANIRGNSDLIQDGAGGYLVVNNNYVNALKFILQKPDKWLEMGEFNQNKIMEFGQETINRRMSEIYQDVLLKQI